MADMQAPMPMNMPNIGKIDIMKVQQALQSLQGAEPIDLVAKYHEWEQEAQSQKQYVLWNPEFRKKLVDLFGNDPEIGALIEKLYLEMLQIFYDAQEALRDKIRKATSDLMEDAASKLGT